MTLSRILAIAVSLLMAVVFIGTLLINVGSTRDYLTEQLASHAEDAATSLGLSISATDVSRNVPAIESMVDAIFDRGYYREISVRRIDGQAILERRLRVDGVDAPRWFVDAIPLETPVGESVVMDGWRQVATIRVRSHPGYAYARLWASARDLGVWFAGAWLAAVALLLLVLRLLLAPLRAVEGQALAIGDRRFAVLEVVPRTRELRRVVSAMNAMSVKVKRMFAEHADMIERVREEAHRDPVSGFPNRRYFLERLEHLLATPDELGAGMLFLIHLDGIQACNEARGRDAGDRLVGEAARRLEAGLRLGPEAVFGRIDGARFALLVGAADVCAPARIAAGVQEALAPLALTVRVGEAPLVPGASGASLLATADARLRATFSRPESDTPTTADGEALSRLLHDALSDGRLLLHFQPVLGLREERIFSHEVLVRIADAAGKEVPAGAFLPIAERHGLVGRLDRLVIATLLGRLDEPALAGGEFAVNVSAASLADADFVRWLVAEVPACFRQRLVIEIAQPDDDGGFARLAGDLASLREAGWRCALDHFGAGFGSFSRLIDLRLAYIKLDGGIVRGLADRPASRFFVEEVARMARGIDLPVLAAGVESEADREALRACGIDGVQGYFVGRPQLR